MITEAMRLVAAAKSAGRKQVLALGLSAGSLGTHVGKSPVAASLRGWFQQHVAADQSDPSATHPGWW